MGTHPIFESDFDCLTVMIESNDFNDDDEIQVTIRLLFKGNQVGTIIGRKGTKITQIREESACEIKVKGNDQDVERIILVAGLPSGVTRALLKIAEFVEADLNDGLTGRTTKIPVTLNMIVPTSQCGSIIGRQGTRIREIREKTGCNVRIANDLLPNSSEKLITLYGEPRVIESCVEAICHVMIEDKPHGKPNPYTPRTYGPSLVFGMEGMPRHNQSGGGGASGNGGGGAQFAAQPQGNPFYNAPPHISRNINNNIQHFAQAAPAHVQGQWNQNGQSNGQNNGHSHHPPHIAHIQHQMQPRFQHQPYGQFNTQPMMPQSDPVAILRDSSLECFKTKLPTTKNPDGATEIRVDNDKIGAIIGRGGSRIAEIRRYSTQDIKIHEKDEASATRRITVNGQQDQIDRAVFLLHVCLNVYTKPKEKVGQWTLLQAVHYARGNESTKNIPQVPYPDSGMITYPNFMDYNAQFLPQHRFQAPRVNQYPMSTKKRNLPEPSMEIAAATTTTATTPTQQQQQQQQQHDQEEIPTNAKREKFRTY